MPQTAGLPAWAGNLQVALRASSHDLAEIYDAMGLDDDGGWVGLALAGRRRPSDDELSVLSAYTDLPLTVLAGYVAPRDDLKVALRSGLLELERADAEFADRARVLLVALRELLELFPDVAADRDQKMRLATQARSGKTFAEQAGRYAAGNLRALLDLDDEPVVDLVGLVESLGCPVVMTALPDGVHGMTVHDEQRGDWRAVIMVNSGDWWTRQRYTLAHELCHVLYRDGASVIVDRGGDVDETDYSEWRAECFARHFLAPDETVRRVWRQHERRGAEAALAEVIMHCGISRDAAVRAVSESLGIPRTRLHSLEETRVKDLMEHAGLGDQWSEACREQGSPGASEWLLMMALGAHREGLVDAATVAAVLDEDDVGKVSADLAAQGWAPPGPA